jgi:5,10-methylenetetrahydrofolate reductase
VASSEAIAARPFASALSNHPLLFEPVPPGARIPSGARQDRLGALADLVRSVPRVDGLVIPELVDENHEGKPRYRSGDLRAFGAELQTRTGREAIVNKVVAHLASPAELEAWARDTVARQVRHAVLVGGASRYIPYSGPAVVEANRVCRPVFREAEGTIGNIAICQRTGEPHRMLSKTRAGAAFFTTQILFDAEPVVRVVREYDLLCRQAAIPPGALIVSVAPITDEGDLEFVEWLGADPSDEAEDVLLGGPENETARRSEDRAIAVWDELLSTVTREELVVPLGVNVEQISPRHLEAAGRLLRRFADRIPFASG